jgi:hypothetical protein
VTKIAAARRLEHPLLLINVRLLKQSIVAVKIAFPWLFSGYA